MQREGRGRSLGFVRRVGSISGPDGSRRWGEGPSGEAGMQASQEDEDFLGSGSAVAGLACRWGGGGQFFDGGARRTATATPFVRGGRGGARRTATATATSFIHGGHGGARRTATATATSFIHGGHGGARRTATATPFVRGGRGGARRTVTATPLVHGGRRRGTAGGGGTGEETGAGAVRPGFVGGRCGGAAPAQGRPLAADRPELQWSVISG